MQQVEANIISLLENRIFFGEVTIKDGRIFSVINKGEAKPKLPYVCPGFIDAHVHIESSMLAPAEFARLAVCHGTVATVSDPHEIANVLGLEGVNYMIENGKTQPFKFYFGAPSCVPATTFETAGAIIDPSGVETLLRKPEVVYLAEMMNFPGVINKDPEVLKKLAIAKALGKPIDGHAPGLRGDAAKSYFEAGISTDHECFELEEAKEKLELGVKILIREGSAAKNFEALIPLAIENSERMMFCSDDLHPDNLVKGHINLLVKRAVEAGVHLFDALKMACLNPVLHYGLDVGLLREGEPADFIILKDIKSFEVAATYINGQKVAYQGKSLSPYKKSPLVNNFNTKPISLDQLKVLQNGFGKVNVIVCQDGQLITKKLVEATKSHNGELKPDLEKDLLKVVVYNRYKNAEPAIGFINGFGLKKGAIASTVAHDSHNIIAVGTSDLDIKDAINKLVDLKGGIVGVSEEKLGFIPLPIAGLMSEKDGYSIAKDYETLESFVKTNIGCSLQSPFMSLSFMALLVIPELKLSDKGLFDGTQFKFVDLQVV